MQIYFLTIFYLILTAFFLLIESYREYLTFMIRYRHILLSSIKLRIVFSVFGVFLGVLNLLFPSSPGPKFLGDLIPAISLLLASIYYLSLKEERIGDATLYGKGRTRGVILLVVACFHFLLPNCVLL